MLELLLIANILLQVADVVTTIVIINRGGTEKNPLMLMMKRWLPGFAWLLVGKLIALGVIGFLYYHESDVGLAIVAAIYMAVVLWNYRQLK